MKLRFSRNNTGNTVEILKKGSPEAFSYPLFIQYILDGETFEDAEYVPADSFEDYEQTAINSMIEKIRAAVQNPESEEADPTVEGGSE